MDEPGSTSGDEKPGPPPSPAPASERQPIFLLPGPVLALCGVLLAIQAATDLLLDQQGHELLLEWFAFVPYRLIAPDSIAGGIWPILWTPFTSAFLHAGWQHVILNTIWLAIFATPVTQRYGAVRMFVLFLVGAGLGAVAFALTTLPQVQVLLGASGGVAALTGAAVRFVFERPVIAVDPETGERRLLGRHLASLRGTFANPTARFFSIAWIVLNGLVPVLPIFVGGGVQIAWQAHIAGFVAGLLLVPLLERRQR